MEQLKAKIKQCADERRTYQEQLEHIYEVVAGDNGYERYDHIEFVDFLNMVYGDYLLMQFATSDEYIELLRRQEEEA
ncbi:MAG: hypothetical protein NZ824_12185 [Candidatus Thioglobus sp.]|nr:hypothetical protein [Candidatus Thioglobus sp.]